MWVQVVINTEGPGGGLLTGRKAGGRTDGQDGPQARHSSGGGGGVVRV